MISLLVILCCFVFLAAANPLAQLLLQANPNLLQNGFNNIPNLQIPNQQQSANPYSLPHVVQNPVNNPYQQNYLTQTPTARQATHRNSNDQQLNKFLSNPMLQMILDPKTKFIDPNGVEISKQSNNLPNKEVTPHIINNYYILSPECLHTNEKEGTKTIKVKDQLGNHKSRKDATQNSQRNTEEPIRINHDRKQHHKTSLQGTSQNVINDQQRNFNFKPPNQNNKSSKKNHTIESNNKPSDRKSNTTTKEHSHNDNSGRKTKKKQNTFENREKPVEGIEESLDIRDNTEVLLNHNQNSTSANSKRRRRKKARKHTDDSLEKNEVILKAAKLPSEHVTSEDAAKIHVGDNDIKNAKIKDTERLNLKENKVRTGNNYRRSSRDEAVIKKIHAKFPAIPEEVIRNLLHYLRRQLRNQLENNSSWQYTNYKPPIKYEQLFPQFYNLDFNNYKIKDTNNRRRNHGNRKKVKQVNSKAFKDTITTQDVDTESTTISLTTKEIKYLEKEESAKKLKINEVRIENKDSKVEYTTTQYDEEPQNTSHSTRTEITTIMNDCDQAPKLGEEDVVNILPENFVDDYYPDFRTDTIYFDKNIRNLRHNRYYYTTDRNYLKQKGKINFDNSTEIYYEPFKPTTIANNYKININEEADVKIPQILEVSLENPLESLEYTNYEVTLRPLSEELEFKTPPGLENPDFETKPVRSEYEGPYYRPEFKHATEDKTYDAKSSTYSVTKQVNVPSKPRNDNIETVFARSKVVKYGHNEDLSKDKDLSKDENFSKDKFNNNESKNNDAVVYAKSISSEYW